MEKVLGEKALRTREQIIAQSMLLFRQKGVKDTTIQDICEATEVSIGTFYAYFKNKGELFSYNFTKKPDDSFAKFLKENISGNTAFEKITSFLRYYAWLNIGTDLDMLKKKYAPQSDWFSSNPPMYDVLHQIIKEGQKSGEITNALSSEDIVNMLKTYMRGCCYEWVMEEREFDIEQRLVLYVGQLAKSLLL